jgi:hypothetical protein
LQANALPGIYVITNGTNLGLNILMGIPTGAASVIVPGYTRPIERGDNFYFVYCPHQ